MRIFLIAWREFTVKVIVPLIQTLSCVSLHYWHRTSLKPRHDVLFSPACTKTPSIVLWVYTACVCEYFRCGHCSVLLWSFNEQKCCYRSGVWTGPGLCLRCLSRSVNTVGVHLLFLPVRDRSDALSLCTTFLRLDPHNVLMSGPEGNMTDDVYSPCRFWVFWECWCWMMSQSHDVLRWSGGGAGGG